jgi:Phosphoenolpyruvate-protein kinase (PTS system EI component in bacteria)
MEKGRPPEIVLTGVAGSSGICIGKAYLVDKEGVDLVEKYAIDRKHLLAEVRRFQNAVKAARDELLSIIDSAPEDLRRYTNILETHITMLQDKALYDRTIETIRKRMRQRRMGL